MPNDSSTGGYLLPLDEPKPLEGRELNDFLQGWVAGVTGLAGSLVRPRWQAEPPNVPPGATAWAAVGAQTRPADEFPLIIHNPNGNGGNGQDELHQHEDIDVLVSFYDLGSNGQADEFAARLRQGLAINQNLEPLTAQGMGLIGIGPAIPLPTLFKTRWNYRVDLTVSIKREIIRIYPVQSVTAIDITLEAESVGGALLTKDIIVQQE
jgi:hypothetical protein